jgi:hypothetical protein
LRGFQQKQKHGFQCEKSVQRWSGPDAVAKAQKEVFQADLVADLANLHRRWLVFTGERVNADIF